MLNCHSPFTFSRCPRHFPLATFLGPVCWHFRVSGLSATSLPAVIPFCIHKEPRQRWMESGRKMGMKLRGGWGFGNTQAAQKVIAIANSVDVFMAHSVNQTIAKLKGNSFRHCKKYLPIQCHMQIIWTVYYTKSYASFDNLQILYGDLHKSILIDIDQHFRNLGIHWNVVVFFLSALTTHSITKHTPAYIPTIVVDSRTQLATPRQLNIFRQNRTTTPTTTAPAKRTKGKKKRICSGMNTPSHSFHFFFFANFYGLFNKTQRYISSSGVSRKTGRENKWKDCKEGRDWQELAGKCPWLARSRQNRKVSKKL